MPRQESTALQELENQDAEAEVNATVDDMADAYAAYTDALRIRLGATTPLQEDLREQLVEDIHNRLVVAG